MSLRGLRERTVDVGASPGILELQGAPENALFRRLDNCRERDIPRIEPGNVLIAIYGAQRLLLVNIEMAGHGIVPLMYRLADCR